MDRYGTDVILEATVGREVRRRVDWTDPPAEGEWDTTASLAGDDE